jgi:hypothetical protein
MKKDTKKQSPSPTDDLRSKILATKVPLTSFAERCAINYLRFRRIVNEGSRPTYDEGLRIRAALGEFSKAAAPTDIIIQN